MPPAHAYKRPKFTRADCEMLGTYAHTSILKAAGDYLFQLACNEAYWYKDVRYGSMRSLSDAIRKEYVQHTSGAWRCQHKCLRTAGQKSVPVAA